MEAVVLVRNVRIINRSGRLRVISVPVNHCDCENFFTTSSCYERDFYSDFDNAIIDDIVVKPPRHVEPKILRKKGLIN